MKREEFVMGVGETRFFLPLKVCFYYRAFKVSKWQTNLKQGWAGSWQVIPAAPLLIAGTITTHNKVSNNEVNDFCHQPSRESPTIVTAQQLSPALVCSRVTAQTHAWLGQWLLATAESATTITYIYSTSACILSPLCTVSFKLPCLFDYGSFCLNYEYREFPRIL